MKYAGVALRRFGRSPDFSEENVGAVVKHMTTKGFVYILQSLKNNRFYIGSTTNIDIRLKQHNQGAVKATKNIRPLRLVFKQGYPKIQIAKKIELRLKKFKRRDFIVKIIKDGRIKMKV